MSYSQEQEDSAKEVIALARGDFYRTLGLSRSCTEADIKKAYRKLALKFHPDKNSAPSAEAAFLALSTAMTTLSEPISRQQYDALGHATVVGNQNTNGEKSTSKMEKWPESWPRQMPVEDLVEKLLKKNIYLFSVPTSSNRSTGAKRLLPEKYKELFLFLPIAVFIIAFSALYVFQCDQPPLLSDSYTVRLSGSCEGPHSELHFVQSQRLTKPSTFCTVPKFSSNFRENIEFNRAVDWEYRFLLAKECAGEWQAFERSSARLVADRHGVPTELLNVGRESNRTSTNACDEYISRYVNQKAT